MRPTRLPLSPPTRERVAQTVETQFEKYKNARSGNIGDVLRDSSSLLYSIPDSEEDCIPLLYPHALLVEFLNKEKLREVLEQLFETSGHSVGRGIDYYVEKICGNGKPDRFGEYGRLFAILALSEKSEQIFKFIDQGVGDSSLPLGRSEKFDKRALLYRKGESSEPLPFTQKWSAASRETFSYLQPRVNLPCFEHVSGGGVQHQDFQDNAIMPWIEYLPEPRGPQGSGAQSKAVSNGFGGGFCDIIRVVIHDGHHKFDGLSEAEITGPILSFAIKKLHTTEEEKFRKEVRMLSHFGGMDHTVRLLGTFSQKGQYSLIFPWAECDLTEYWRRVQVLSQEEWSVPNLARWISQQCCGILEALKNMHEASQDPNLNDDLLKADDAKKDDPDNSLFGRHGDLKPENILWFNDSADPDNIAAGRLVISDFGLSAANHKNSRTFTHPGNIAHTSTYAPPEIKFKIEGVHVSRACDIWSLGCVFLEFVTWLLGGGELVKRFEDSRYVHHEEVHVEMDFFWQSDGGSYVVKSQVVDWFKTLRGHENATSYTQDFLDIIQKDMLLIDKDKRLKSKELLKTFKALNKKCQDDEYCTPGIHLAFGRTSL
ncbi:kinase-like domain-containing protein [Podospora didyma]|uniref:Kinase-like domain-containing protein n=1 Tax=Podospora didyma TaxID=330526 RepID=A0AAE0NBV9_9PEZI|nr:kinase-like domain-containing protein [Podospora didyma]